MKVFVVGAIGALGSRLVPLLVQQGHEVVGTSRSPGKAQRLPALGAESVVLDLLDRTAVREAVLAARPDAIVHQATALAGVSDFKHFDRSFAETNRLRTVGTDALLAAAREAGARRFIAQSYAGWPYARVGGPVKTEDDPLDPSPAAGMSETRVVASGGLGEHRIAELVAAGAPIDTWGVGTELGTSGDSPSLDAVYKLVAERREGAWRGLAKTSEGKTDVPGAKQVFRSVRDGEMTGDVIAGVDEDLGGEPLLVPAMRGGEIVLTETIEQMRERTTASLSALPRGLRLGDGEPYGVAFSERLRTFVRDA